MSFTFEKLNKLNLKQGELIQIKYSSVNKFVSGKIATDKTFNIENYPIFDSTKTKIYIHFSPQISPSELDIANIEYFFRPDSRPILYENNNHFIPDLKNFGNLNQGSVYDFLKVNGDIETLRFHSITIGKVNEGNSSLLLNYVKHTGKIAKINLHVIIDTI